jgi:hypothetical protein
VRAASGRIVAGALVFVLVGVLSAPGAASAGGGGEQPDRGRWYRSKRGSDPAVRMLVVGERPDGRRMVAVDASFACDELELEGELLVTVKRNGAFAGESGSFILSGGGTDEVDAEVRVEGRFADRGASGTIAAEAEAFDNAGITGTCDEELDWRVRRRAPDPSLDRIEETVALDSGAALVAAAPDAAYVVTAPEAAGEARLHRIDAATGEAAWEVEPGVEVGGIAATASGVWIVDENGSEVLRFDPASGDPAATIPLGESSFAPAIGATDAAVWVVTGDLHRIDPVSNAVAATVELGGGAEDAALALNTGAVFVALNLHPREGSTDLPHRVVRVDPATDAIVTDVEGVDHFDALAASEDTLWAAPFFDPLRVLDPATLEDAGSIDVVAHAATAAPPGAWLLTDRGVAAYDNTETAEPMVRIPLLGRDFGTIAATADTVWGWDPALGTLTQISAG